jgi:hypothetical protein
MKMMNNVKRNDPTINFTIEKCEYLPDLQTGNDEE